VRAFMEERRIKERRVMDRRIEDRRKNLALLQDQVKELRSIIFNMLNYTNMYILVLDQQMLIKFINNSLANDLGYDKFDDLLGKCWLDFIDENDKETIKIMHTSIANGYENWETYKEFQNEINGKDGEKINVCWFNSHINTDYNWTFSFGIKKEIETHSMDSIRDYYQDIISKDRVMISAMRDVIGLKNKKEDFCVPF
jgi:PAS domain S-box-containing protein